VLGHYPRDGLKVPAYQTGGQRGSPYCTVLLERFRISLYRHRSSTLITVLHVSMTWTTTTTVKIQTQRSTLSGRNGEVDVTAYDIRTLYVTDMNGSSPTVSPSVGEALGK